MASEIKSARNEVVKAAWAEGFSTMHIKRLLAQHGEVLSVRQIRRILKAAGVGMHNDTPLADVVSAIQEELTGPAQGIGYRMMWRRLKCRWNFNVSRRMVQHAMSMLNPDGCELRRQRRLRRREYINPGPSYCIHADGYDKLKPFGLCIHGAIDGYSRKLLWLKVGPTNNDPRVIGGYFLDYVRECKGVPRLLRTDAGTENTLMHDIQKALRWEHTDDKAAEKSILIGRSVANQRIERYWRDLRQHMQYIINHLKDLCEIGNFTRHDEMDKELVRFCFTDVVQLQLDYAKNTWNSHYIRRSNGAECQPGVPNVLYAAPDTPGAADYLQLVSEEDLEDIEPFVSRPCSVLNPENSELFQELQGNESNPRTVNDCVRLYATIKERMNVN